MYTSLSKFAVFTKSIRWVITQVEVWCTSRLETRSVLFVLVWQPSTPPTAPGPPYFLAVFLPLLLHHLLLLQHHYLYPLPFNYPSPATSLSLSSILSPPPSISYPPHHPYPIHRYHVPSLRSNPRCCRFRPHPLASRLTLPRPPRTPILLLHHPPHNPRLRSQQSHLQIHPQQALQSQNVLGSDQGHAWSVKEVG